MNDPHLNIIAELSGNHNGSKDRALSLIEAAADAGATMVKVQCFKPDLITVKSDNEIYRVNGGEWDGKSLYDLYSATYLPWEWYDDLIASSKVLGLEFFASVFDEVSADFLLSKGCETVKIASPEIIDLDLLTYCAERFQTILLSTGMASKDEIITAHKIFSKYSIESVLLQCVSEYPARAEDYNLGGLAFLSRYGNHTGISDHSMDDIAVLGAVAKGATYIEKHLTMRRLDGGVDSHFSLEPHEFKQMVTAAHKMAKACVLEDYAEVNSDQGSRKYRRSLYITPSLRAGDIIREKDLISRRPALGDEVANKSGYIGKKLKIDIDEISPLTMNMIEA